MDLARSESPEWPNVEALIADAEARDDDHPLALPVRSLLRTFRSRQRTPEVIQFINSKLAEHGLEAYPAIGEGLMDGTVQLRRLEPFAAELDESLEHVAGAAQPTRDLLRVDRIPAATSGVIAVNPQESLAKARSIMLRYDFSQLPVMPTERVVDGAVTWASMSIALLADPEAGLREAATVECRVVPVQADLLSIIPAVIESGFVLVRDRTNVIAGLVTPADISSMFVELTNPFLMIGEIEKLLRDLIERCFSVEHIAAVRQDDDAGRELRRADEMTFGDYKALLEVESNWERIESGLDRVEFIAALDEVRIIRNDVVHFSPDPLSEQDIERLRRFIDWLRVIEKLQGATSFG